MANSIVHLGSFSFSAHDQTWRISFNKNPSEKKIDIIVERWKEDQFQRYQTLDETSMTINDNERSICALLTAYPEDEQKRIIKQIATQQRHIIFEFVPNQDRIQTIWVDAGVGDYQYTYGAGSEPNRRIDFFPTVDQKGVFAKVSAFAIANWVEISRVYPENISIDMMSTTDKMQALMKARETNSYVDYQSSRKLSSFSLDEQMQYIQALEPKGPWRIEITNDIGANPQYENVIHLKLFNPS